MSLIEHLILSLKAGGVGLNLQEASYVFHLDRWWNPAVERQAEDRSHRMGQVVPVTVLKYTCQGTIEERIEKVLADKQQLFDEIIDDVSLDVASKLTRDDIFGLFGLEPPISSPQPRSANRDGLELEERCAAVLQSRGWDVQRTPRSRDGGIDLIASRIDEVGLTQTLYVQCKDYARPVGVEIVRELLGVLPPDGSVRALIVAAAGLTVDAAKLAERRNVTVWDEVNPPAVREQLLKGAAECLQRILRDWKSSNPTFGRQQTICVLIRSSRQANTVCPYLASSSCVMRRIVITRPAAR